jgi:hypothetical protein
MRPRRRFETFGTIGILGLLVLGLSTPSIAQGVGRCIRAELPAPLVLPDGSRHEAGTMMRICLTRNLTPVSGLHETSVDGYTIGLLMSSRVSMENRRQPGQPFFVFERTAKDGLRLLAYSVAEGREMATFLFNDPPALRFSQSARKKHRPEERQRALSAGLEDGSLLVAMAL